MNSSQPESGPSRRELQPYHVNPERVLVVEDDPETHGIIREILEGDGYQVDVATSLEELRKHGDWAQYAAVLLDRILPDGTTDELLPEICRHAPDTAIIVVTGH